MKEYILDTNCLLRYLLHDNIAQSNKVKKFFSQALSLKISIMIPIVVFTETVYAMVKLYKFERIIVADKLKTIVNNAYLEIERREILLQAGGKMLEIVTMFSGSIPASRSANSNEVK